MATKKKSVSKKTAKKAVKKTAKKSSAKKTKSAPKKASTPMVKIYSTPTCPWCDRTKVFLKEHGVKYNDINVITDVKARADMIKKSGQMGVPVIEIGNKIIVGYNEDALKEALNL